MRAVSKRLCEYQQVSPRGHLEDSRRVRQMVVCLGSGWERSRRLACLQTGRLRGDYGELAWGHTRMESGVAQHIRVRGQHTVLATPSIH